MGLILLSLDGNNRDNWDKSEICMQDNTIYFIGGYRTRFQHHMLSFSNAHRRISSRQEFWESSPETIIKKTKAGVPFFLMCFSCREKARVNIICFSFSNLFTARSLCLAESFFGTLLGKPCITSKQGLGCFFGRVLLVEGKGQAQTKRQAR